MGALDTHGLIKGSPVSATEQVASAFDFVVRRVFSFVPPYPFQEHRLCHLEYERGARVADEEAPIGAFSPAWDNWQQLLLWPTR